MAISEVLKNGNPLEDDIKTCNSVVNKPHISLMLEMMKHICVPGRRNSGYYHR